MRATPGDTVPLEIPAADSGGGGAPPQAPLDLTFQATQHPSPADGQAASTVLHAPRGEDPGAPPDSGALFPPLPWLRAEGVIGVGGMGTVLRGRDLDLNRELAIKVLDPRLRDCPEAALRFVHEAQVNCQLQHPNIAPIYSLNYGPDGRPFFTMRLVTGRNLGELLAARSGPEEDQAHFLEVFQDTCRTVAYAHSRGVIHRDLKPQNVMVGEFGEVYVMDWGLAKVLRGQAGFAPSDDIGALRTVRTDGADEDSEAPWLSRAGEAVGSPAYIPPEQARGQAFTADQRADAFGLGAILCEILTGRPPFDAQEANLEFAARGDLSSAFNRLERSGADSELVVLAKSCLAPDPGDRPADAAAVAAAITGYLDGVRERLRNAEIARTEAQAAARQERRVRRLVVALAAAVGGLLALVGGGWAFLDQQDREHRRQVGQHVQILMSHAQDLQTRATASGDPELWGQAVSAADRAAQVLAERGGEPALSSWVENRRAALKVNQANALRAVAARSRDQEMSDRLDELHQRVVDVAPGASEPGLAARHRRAFLDYGLELESWSQDYSGVRIAASVIAPALTTALDDWQAIAEPREREFLRVIALGADPDPVRTEAREAMARGDRAVLLGLVEEAVDSGSPETAIVLSRALIRAGAVAEGVGVLRRAIQEHPGDLRVNRDLALALPRLDPPRWDEALVYAQATVALRPDDAWEWCRLGQVLARLGHRDRAADAFREATALRPKFPPAWAGLIRLAREAGPGAADADLKAAQVALEGDAEALRELERALAR
jgi:tetratricopeptide (TPR) repeat protein